jgi:lipopolysaccharide transport system permease protein
VTRTTFLLRELVIRDLRSRYTGSVFGFVWAFLYPLWQLALFSLVFAIILRIPLVGERTSSFAAFLFAGLVPWIAFQEAVSRGATAIVDNANLVKKMRFPSQVLVLSVVVSALIHSLIALGLFAVIQAVRGEIAPGHLPWLLVGLAGQLALTTGLALLVAALQVYLRDVVHSLTLVLSALFYVTPIVYPVGLVPEALRRWLALNPLTTVVALYRSFLISGDAPSLAAVAGLCIGAAAVLAAGAAVYRRLCTGFADEL